MKQFQDLMVWQKAHQLALKVYQITIRFPSEERYGLVNQMRRSAISVPANLVEGHKRGSKREFANFMSIAEGSLEELKYYLQLSKDLGYLAEETMGGVYRDAEEVGRMLHGLKLHIRKELHDEKRLVPVH